MLTEQTDDLGEEEDLLLAGLFRRHLCRVEETHFEVGVVLVDVGHHGHHGAGTTLATWEDLHGGFPT